MITIVFCTREDNPTHIEHLTKTSGARKGLQVIQIINQGESLTSAYNRGLAQATNDVVVFCHDDLTVVTKQWATKLVKTFESNPEYAILGVAGSKYMPVSGKWWENPRKMYGRVEHTHEGKSWLSAYSSDQGNEVEETLCVDGVFFAVCKSRLKKTFDESVEGFHFYDVDFSFSNHLAGVKVGVITNVRINHQSIGVTNDQWEVNRSKFSVKYEDELPIDMKRVLRKGEKLNILLGCLSFTNLTGSELYIYELAKELVKEGHDVSVCSTIGEPLKTMANKVGIKMYDLKEPPNYKVGDGKTTLVNRHTGQQEVMKENNFYVVGNKQFDILHLNHKPVTEHMLKFYPEVDTVCTIHSEIIALEEPVLNKQIKKYIAIRPEIKDYIVENFHVAEGEVEVVYNPIDYTRFNVSKTSNTKPRTIFVGTIDYLRKNVIQDLIEVTKAANEELWIVGRKTDSYLDDMIAGQQHVKYFPATYRVETLVKQCDKTAGIMLGRTTIEGWMCGKGGWIYNVDKAGEILGKEFNEVPEDVSKFRSDKVAKQIIEVYKSALS